MNSLGSGVMTISLWADLGSRASMSLATVLSPPGLSTRALKLCSSLLYTLQPLSPHRAVGTGLGRSTDATAWMLKDTQRPGQGTDHIVFSVGLIREAFPHPPAPRCFCFCVTMLLTMRCVVVCSPLPSPPSGRGTERFKGPLPPQKKRPKVCGREGLRQMAEPFSASARAD